MTDLEKRLLSALKDLWFVHRTFSPNVPANEQGWTSIDESASDNAEKLIAEVEAAHV